MHQHISYLGFDFGTRGARAHLINGAGEILYKASLRFDRNTWQEWQNALFHLLDGIPAQYCGNIASMAICGTSGTSLLCNEAGNPIMPALLYNDQRASKEADAIKTIANDSHITATPSSSLAKLLWLHEHTEAGSAKFFLHQADWLGMLLHGKSGISDDHNALKLGVNVVDRSYPAWIQALPIANLLPKVVEPGSVIGQIQPAIAQNFNLSQSCIIRAGTTDSIAAFFASGAHQSGDAVTSLGSTLVLKLLSDYRVDAPEYGIYSHRCGNRWLAGGASNTGGAILEQLFGHDRINELCKFVHPEIPTGLDYYPLPFTGERFPINDANLLPRLTPRPESDSVYLQGILESLARIEHQGYDLLANLGATPKSSIRTAGGGASNTIWETIRKNTLKVDFIHSHETEAAYGAALLARDGQKLLY